MEHKIWAIQNSSEAANLMAAEQAAQRREAIVGYYQQYLERIPNEDEIRFHKQSGYSTEALRDIFANSPEAANLIAAKQAAQQATQRREAIVGYYQQYLERIPNQSEIDYHDRSGYSIEALRDIFANSPEAANLIAAKQATQRRQAIVSYYQTILHRIPSEDEIRFHDESGRDLETLRNDFINSPEALSKR